MIRAVIAFAVLAACTSPKPHAPEHAAAPALPPPRPAAAARPVLLVLGTFHMTSDGSDVLAVKAPDVLAPERQREIEQLVELIARFRPTKVALEKPLDDAETREHYRRYVAGDYALTRNEVDQVGFRIAKALGHAEVYPVDWRNKFDLAPVFASAGKHDQGALLGQAFGEARAYAAELQRYMAQPIIDAYRFVNDVPRAEELHRLYLRLLRIGKGDDYAAADLLADWYERNLKLTANVIKLAGSPAERIVFLVGSGHLHLVRQLAAESGAFELAPALDYLSPGVDPDTGRSAPGAAAARR